MMNAIGDNIGWVMAGFAFFSSLIVFLAGMISDSASARMAGTLLVVGGFVLGMVAPPLFEPDIAKHFVDEPIAYCAHNGGVLTSTGGMFGLFPSNVCKDGVEVRYVGATRAVRMKHWDGSPVVDAPTAPIVVP